MANVTKLKRDEMLAYINQLKQLHTDDESIKALNEIENHLTDKKFGLVFEEHTEEADEKLKDYIPVLCADTERLICKDDSLPYNFIIEGDNLHALYLLEKTHKGKVDCIYIDPPYNTGAKDWKYNNDYVDSNDVYRHSKWLSMMQKRLQIAKKLLNPKSGIIIIAIDDNELNTLGLLLKEIFLDYKHFCITVVHNPNGNQGKNFGICNEFLYFLLPDNNQHLALENRVDNPDVRPLRDVSGNNNLRTDAKNCFYPIFVKNGNIIGFGDVCEDNFHPSSANIMREDGILEIYPIDTNGVEKKWVFARHTVESIKNELKVEYNRLRKIYDIIRYKTHFTYKSVWTKKDYNANSYGSKLINNIIGNRFNYPKSLYAVYECIYAATLNKKEALVLDFFAGSGTTQHAVNLLNKYDNGSRKCIMVTNNEISLEEEKKLTKLGFKKGDPEWEELGIAKYVNWPRTLCSINGVDINGKPLKGDYLVKDAVGNVITMSQGFNCNVKYFKCDWVERRPEDYLLSNALSLHIKEMIELQNFIDLDNEKYLLILTKNDFKKFILNNGKKDLIQKVWVNQNIVFDSNEIKELKKYKFKYIPKEFFGQELKEVAE